ncbi:MULTISPECIES: glycosyl hydrolase family 95 catalytic domain-containing protein [unclassified Lentimonas]|uniref:glycoside hydrolase family 95 protein n=1 Tax=unclassified Lentimonas TaxID=2630993 RepID=UPI00132A0B3A|nr:MULTISPECIES: glycoside hydrolase family 95 protein [unclassified Lentimonas]CAA6677623.1 putative large secreted protein [Lentimonas sp. CC4]CAA6684279.1 putative large secreted protein [Lentimonas sp. CC6]CAA7078205.1 putative large secreted protein [Lentimonas sp. CC4]CAA7168279.1 putative large secreted protein [Lentimonas sp. CC21]CAA7181887.1 putative large secreted protein [Lentimonas sp. CC8]
MKIVKHILCAGLCLTGLAGNLAAEQNSELIAEQPGKALRLWYDAPAPDSDLGWANASIPMGNGYMGVNIFGGTATDRIQITENSLYDWADKNSGLKRRGVNNFAEVYIDFEHDQASNYVRDLNLNEGVSSVQYEHGGVSYSREYFTSYPDKVMVVRLKASEPGKLSFTLRPTIPFIGDGKTGSVSAEGDTVTLSGVMTYYDIKFEGQFKVIPQGGTVEASKATVTVSDADSAVIVIAVGTNYEVDPKVFLTAQPTEKLAGFPHPHEKVSQYIADAAALSYEELLANHQADYKELYDRVSLDLGATQPSIPTDEMVDAYPNGASDLYLEELAFQFGRYMLICSSRAGTLPPHLQGIWNVYARPPWSSQYLHDTNVQMAYAPVFSANLPELFESYAGYFNAFVHRQREYADQYIKQYNPSQLDPDGDNGWSGPFWSNPYNVPGKTPIAGFGTGGWICHMFWDYYDFTRDEALLDETVYPVLYEQSNFISRFVQEIDGKLLAKPSSSPEQYLEGKKKRETIGTTFDQQMFYETHYHTLKAAKILGNTDERLALYEEQLPLLDPIQIGKSGQIKEFREEEFYADAGKSIDPHHRHTSMLLGSYPGQLINGSTPAWLDAVKETLTLRTRKSNIGWARAERVAFWARVYDGDEAYLFYRDLLEGNFMHNLFNDHRGGPLFQADGNYGATAGVAELLLQSQDYVLSPLAALPSAWPDGSYRGLLARGNFEVSAQWSNGQASQLEVLSNAGGTLKLRYPNIAKAAIKTSEGQAVTFAAKGTDQVSIESTKGETYVVSEIPAYVPVAAPSNLKIEQGNRFNRIKLSWAESADAASYNLYRAVGNAPDYELIASDIKGTVFNYKVTDIKEIEQMTLKVAAVGANGRESVHGATVIWLAE